MTIEGFSTWLSTTPVSLTIQTVSWIIPTVQSIHIVAICVVVSSSLLLDLGLVGAMGRDESVSTAARRYIPWLWCALVILLATGLVLIVGEPNRTLQNLAFWTKMVLVASIVVITAIVQRPLRRDHGYWEAIEHRGIGKFIGGVSLVIIAAIICGRWIAYMI